MSTQTVAPKIEMPPIPSLREADKLTRPLVAQSEELVIKDEDSFIASWALVERHDAAIKKIGEMFDPFVDGLHKLHKMAVGLRNQFLDPIAASKGRLLRNRGIYRAEQDKLNREAADREAERLRKQQAKELEKEAKAFEKKGDVETAGVVREQAKNMPAPGVAVAPATPKQEGSVITKKWKFAVDNETLVPNEYRTVDESKIRKVVNALGDKAIIPGVRIWPETSEHSRAVR